jgi:hypothetical protein
MIRGKRMKVIHVLKKIEQLDEDIKELRKMEKSLQRNKSFSTPIYMTIEKQINILLGDRIKLLEMKIDNPPEYLAKEFDGEKNGDIVKTLRKQDKKTPLKKPEKGTADKKKNNKKTPTGKSVTSKGHDIDDDAEIPMLTQDMIDSKFSSIKKSSDAKHETKKDNDRKLLIPKPSDNSEKEKDDKDVKLLDIALEKGTLNQEVIDKEKKRVRFFRDNFPGGEY